MIIYIYIPVYILFYLFLFCCCRAAGRVLPSREGGAGREGSGNWTAVAGQRESLDCRGSQLRGTSSAQPGTQRAQSNSTPRAAEVPQPKPETTHTHKHLKIYILIISKKFVSVSRVAVGVLASPGTWQAQCRSGRTSSC